MPSWLRKKLKKQKTKTTLHLESILLGRFLLREETSKNNVSKPGLLFLILIHLIPTVNLQGNSHLIEGIQRSLISDSMHTVVQRQRCHQGTPLLASKLQATLHLLLCSAVMSGSCPWNSPGKNTGVGCHFLLQVIFPMQDRTHVSCIFCIGKQILYH